MIAKPIESIAESDLVQLIEASTPESKRLEYKRELPDTSDSGKVKFLRSVTALANTQGGDLIYGMEAVDGIARQLHALAMVSSDQLLQRLESLCADGVSPRLAGVVYRFVPLASGGEVLVVRVGKSWNAPHRVNAGGHAHFYGRNAAGAYPLDVGELRQAFTLNESIAERVRNFRAGRLLAIGNGDAPATLIDGARVVFHVVPLQAFSSDIRLELAVRDPQQMQVYQKFSPPGDGGHSQRFSLDGRLMYRRIRDERSNSYCLLFRSGVIEAAQVWPELDGEKFLPGYHYECDVVDALQKYMDGLRELDVVPPFYVFLTMLRVDGYFLDAARRTFTGKRTADRDTLVFPELFLEDWPESIAGKMRPMFDTVWNAFGYERSLNYDANGRWVDGG